MDARREKRKREMNKRDTVVSDGECGVGRQTKFALPHTDPPGRVYYRKITSPFSRANINPLQLFLFALLGRSTGRMRKTPSRSVQSSRWQRQGRQEEQEVKHHVGQAHEIFHGGQTSPSRWAYHMCGREPACFTPRGAKRRRETHSLHDTPSAPPSLATRKRGIH